MADEDKPRLKRKYGVRIPFIFRNPDKGASHRVPEYKFPAQDNEVMQVNFIHCVAKESLIKCKGNTKNTERVFVTGDIVEVIYTSIEDFNKAPNVGVWVLVTKERDNGSKKRLWLRPLELVRERVNVLNERTVPLKVVEHGLVRERRGIIPEVKCSSVLIEDEFIVWIEEGTFPIINADGLLIGNYNYPDPANNTDITSYSDPTNYIDTMYPDPTSYPEPASNPGTYAEAPESMVGSEEPAVQDPPQEYPVFGQSFPFPMNPGFIGCCCYYYYYYDDRSAANAAAINSSNVSNTSNNDNNGGNDDTQANPFNNDEDDDSNKM